MSIAPAAAAPLHIARADMLPMTAPQPDAMIEDTKSSAVTKRTPTWLSFRHETTQCRFSFPSSLESSSVKTSGTATSPSSVKRAPPGDTWSIVHCPMIAPSADLISTGCSTLRRADVLCSAPIAVAPCPDGRVRDFVHSARTRGVLLDDVWRSPKSASFSALPVTYGLNRER